MVLRAFLFLIGERKVPLFIRFIVEIPLLVTVYSNFTGATLWGTVLLWQANRRGAGGNEGKTQGGLPLGNPVCLWQTELFKLNLKSSPSSSGYNRRRRLATRSSGKQQAERTAVRAAPIVCPEESLLGARRRNPPFPDEGLTRRLRRGWWGCRPEGGSTFFRSERKYQRKHAARRLRRRHTSLCAVGFGLREPNGWTTRLYSGRPIPA